MNTHKATIVLAFVLLTGVAYCQISSANGIVVRPSPLNDNVFYYGEPFHIYFEITNSTLLTKQFYIPQTGVNYRVALKNIQTGKTLNDMEDTWQRWTELREKMSQTPPPDQLDFDPNEYYNFAVRSSFHFGTEPLSNKVQQHNTLAYHLRAVPVGKYRLTFSYYLFPGEDVLTDSYEFEVRPVPESEKLAFDAFVKSTEYAYENHFFNKGAYNPRHADSYEQFLAEYPESVYADYVLMDMYTEVYHYPVVSEDIRLEKFQKYATYYEKINRKNVQANYMRRLPAVVGKVEKNNPARALDEFLRKLKERDPALSKVLISAARRDLKIQSLKNYASGGDN